ncbi:hypothetical protein WDJ50_03055 [Deinococcus sp. VB142]|uniref:Uncharacterized protein n=1 Tax=Deinococcus sp. VB142 TaxID=3112952 RepID=A0AAU6Q4D7_9DEIO
MKPVPENIQLEFLRPDGTALTFRELSDEFCRTNGIEGDRKDSPVRVAIASKTSQAGNIFYDFSMNGMPLPDGLNTILRLEGNILSFGPEAKSKNGNPTRKARADILVGGQLYISEGYLTQGKNGYYVKAVAHKKPSPPAPKPRGGSFI